MFVKIRTKNKSSNPLRKTIEVPFRAVCRLGSTTPNEIIFKSSQRFLECNTVESIQNSRSKLRMKECFAKAEVPQTIYFDTYIGTDVFKGIRLFQEPGCEPMRIYSLPYPILVKRVYGFKGRGMAKINNQQELESWLESHPNTEGWYFEEFKNYQREYRLHCTQDECFMVWRKLRRRDEKVRWYFNSDNCNWVGEDHELFDKPVNWDKIVEDCCKAVKAVGLDIGSCDLRIQSSKDKSGNIRENPEYIVVEVNSAPALAEQGIEAYKKIIKKVLIEKYNNE